MRRSHPFSSLCKSGEEGGALVGRSRLVKPTDRYQSASFLFFPNTFARGLTNHGEIFFSLLVFRSAFIASST
jgi:hypothetical protein